MFGLVGHVTAEVPSHDAVPGGVVLFVKLLCGKNTFKVNIKCCSQPIHSKTVEGSGWKWKFACKACTIRPKTFSKCWFWVDITNNLNKVFTTTSSLLNISLRVKNIYIWIRNDTEISETAPVLIFCCVDTQIPAVWSHFLDGEVTPFPLTHSSHSLRLNKVCIAHKGVRTTDL